MLGSKSSFSSLIFISLVFEICAQFNDYEEDNYCNRLIFEENGQEVKEIIEYFKNMETIVQEYKLRCGENYEKKHKREIVDKAQDFHMFDIRFDNLPKRCQRTPIPNNCREATSCTHRSGIYKIEVPLNNTPPFYIECDDETENGSWIVIQRRQDSSIDFFRTWDEYENGFGDIDGEFFIGLKKLYALTNFNGPQELMIVMEDVNGTRAFAKYDEFAIGNETESYKLKSLGKYSGSAGNSLQRHIGMKFSTKDRDNDEDLNDSCALSNTGAWWYKYCHNSNLNGKYGDNNYGKGINWESFRGHTVSLTYVKMMIRLTQ